MSYNLFILKVGISVLLFSIYRLYIFSFLQKEYFFIIYLQRATINQTGIDDFHRTVTLVVKVTTGIKYGLVALGGLLILILIVLISVKCAGQRREVS